MKAKRKRKTGKADHSAKKTRVLARPEKTRRSKYLHYRVNGGPSKFTPETIERLRKAVKLGMFLKHACKSAGVTYVSFNNWMRRGIEARRLLDEGNEIPAVEWAYVHFVEQIDKANAEHLERNLERIDQAAEEDWRAASWSVNVRHGYSEKKTIEHKGRVSGEAPNEDLETRRRFLVAAFTILGGGDESGDAGEQGAVPTLEEIAGNGRLRIVGKDGPTGHLPASNGAGVERPLEPPAGQAAPGGRVAR